MGLLYIQNENVLSPVNLSYVDVIIRPAEEPKREDGKPTSPSRHMVPNGRPRELLEPPFGDTIHRHQPPPQTVIPSGSGWR